MHGLDSVVSLIGTSLVELDLSADTIPPIYCLGWKTWTIISQLLVVRGKLNPGYLVHVHRMGA